MTEPRQSPASGVARIWRTGIDPARAREYEAFARQRSLPMFRAHHGLLGVLFGGAEAARVVVTLWGSSESAAALERSAHYLETVRAIELAGFLRPPQRVDYLPLHDWWLGE